MWAVRLEEEKLLDKELKKRACRKSLQVRFLFVIQIGCRIRAAGNCGRAGSARRGVQGAANVINLKRLLNGKQNVWKYQNGEEKSDSDGREKDV